MTLSCFETGGRTLSPGEARERLLDLVSVPVAEETVALHESHGRILADDIVSPIDVPQNTNAAMDGIAVAWTEDAGSIGWRCVGEGLAGHSPGSAPGHGECVEITTGAPLPAGADSVVMTEALELSDDGRRYLLPGRRVEPGQNVRQAGEDIAWGAMALAAGTPLGAAEQGLLASLGLIELRVRRRPRVAVFSTGDEVTMPGQDLPSAGIYDANRYSLAGLLREGGADVVDLGILADEPDVITQALQSATERVDLAITSGGVSVGRADHVRTALERVGRLAFWQIAMRPGRPLACGTLGACHIPFIGLPGNPVSAMVTAMQFVLPLLARLQGRDTTTKRLTAVAEMALPGRLGRSDFLRGIYHVDAEGVLRVRDTGAQGSGILTSMVAANCLIELDDEWSNVEVGELVTIQLLT